MNDHFRNQDARCAGGEWLRTRPATPGVAFRACERLRPASSALAASRLRPDRAPARSRAQVILHGPRETGSAARNGDTQLNRKLLILRGLWKIDAFTSRCYALALAAEAPDPQTRTLALDDLSHIRLDPSREHRSGEHAGVKLAAFTARVDAGRELRQQIEIETSAGQIGRDDPRIHARQSRLETGRNHLARQRGSRFPPEREERLQSGAREPILAVSPDVLEKEVAERHVREAGRNSLRQRLRASALRRFRWNRATVWTP